MRGCVALTGYKGRSCSMLESRVRSRDTEKDGHKVMPMMLFRKTATQNVRELVQKPWIPRQLKSRGVLASRFANSSEATRLSLPLTANCGQAQTELRDLCLLSFISAHQLTKAAPGSDLLRTAVRLFPRGRSAAGLISSLTPSTGRAAIPKWQDRSRDYLVAFLCGDWFHLSWRYCH